MSTVLGLTGGMGCGKSSVGRLLEARGFRRIDTDEVVRSLLSDDPQVADEIARHFGREVFDTGGGIDRTALAARVFHSRNELEALESILHPRVRRAWEGFVRDNAKFPCCVEIPLLFEKKLEKNFACVICVAAEQAQCLARLASKGISPGAARARMARQLPLGEKILRADHVLSNDGSPSFLIHQVDLLVRLLGADAD